ncbi:hypothetical protein AB0J20_04975 [Micromonospora costi]|uniref:hypothetical protein n=1 Tax=Micromonospora costi TaxID=1530042 RepID=UPI003405DCC1
MTPAAARAVAALELFHPESRDDAAALLRMYVRRDELTPADLAAVLHALAVTELPAPVVPAEPEPSIRRKVRRPVEETRRLALEMLAEPGTTREGVAAALNITPRRLRAVLNNA